MISISSGLRMSVLGYYGLMSVMYEGVIDIYDGGRPSSADEPAGGLLLARVTSGGGAFQAGSGTNGLLITQRYDGSLADNGDWFITGVENGTASWWRWRWGYDDPDTSSVFYPRVDGDVGESLLMPSYEITSGLVTKIDEFNVTIGVC